MTNAMTDQSSAIPEPERGAFLAIDWADKKHAWSLCVPGAPRREHGEIEHAPEAIHIWISLESWSREGNRAWLYRMLSV